MIGVAIYDILKNDTDVSALVGTKIYPIQAKENISAPYITYQEISNIPSPSKGSVSLLDQIRLQISCFAKKHEDCFILAKNSWILAGEAICKKNKKVIVDKRFSS